MITTIIKIPIPHQVSIQPTIIPASNKPDPSMMEYLQFGLSEIGNPSGLSRLGYA